MENTPQSERSGDWLSRLLCLAIAGALSLAAAIVRDTTAPAVVFWLLAATSGLFVFVAVFGPKSLRHGLLAGLSPL
jgi:hypothetical protein